MKLEYPKSFTSIDDTCEILKFLRIESTEFTDCTILFEATFEQLRALYDLGKEHGREQAF